MAYIFLLGFIFLYAIVFNILERSTLSSLRTVAGAGQRSKFVVGLGFGVVNALVLLLLASGLLTNTSGDAYFVATAGFVFIFALLLAAAGLDWLKREETGPTRWMILVGASLIGGIVGTLALHAIVPGDLDPFYLFAGGFIYFYTLVFGSVNLVDIENRQEADATLASLLGVGLGFAAINAIILYILWGVLDLPPTLVGLLAVILVYTQVAGSALALTFDVPQPGLAVAAIVLIYVVYRLIDQGYAADETLPALAILVVAILATLMRNPNLLMAFKGAWLGVLIGILTTATIRGIGTIGVDSLFAAGLLIYTMYIAILAGMRTEPIFFERQQPVKLGALIGGVVGFVVALLSLVAAFGVDWASVADDIVGSSETAYEYALAIVAATVVVGVGMTALRVAMQTFVPEGNYRSRNVERTFVFYKLSSFLMGPFELLLAPVQQKLGVERMAYFFIMPNMLIFGIFILTPMILNFFFGLTVGNSILPKNRWEASDQQLTTSNLERVFDCENVVDTEDGLSINLDPNNCREDRFWRATRNTFFYVIFQVSSMVAFALLTALALNQKIRMRWFFRSMFFYPVLLSPVVVALIWRWMLDFDAGLLNGFLETLGMDRIRFIANQENVNWPRFWVIVVADWAFMGFYTLILLAGLQSIPGSLYEAAQIDGASSLRQFRHITLPLLMPTMTVVIVLALIRAVQVFDQVFVLTGGGPGTATLYMVQYIYQAAFSTTPPNFGLASAASLLLASVLFIATLAQLFFARRTEAA